MKKRFTTEQIIKILKEAQTGKKITDICREYNLRIDLSHMEGHRTEMGVSEAQRLKELEVENSKLKRIVAHLTLDNTALKDVRSKMVSPQIKREASTYLQSHQGLSQRNRAI